jgi:membrane protein implicated in regulation of membrane protease activity
MGGFRAIGEVTTVGGWDWLAWLVLAVVLGIFEVTSLNLVFAMLSVGALAAAVTGLVTGSALLEVVVALVVSVAMLAVVRPVALRHLRTPASLRTGVAALVGTQGLVLEPVDANGGRVKIKGEVWSARSLNPAARYEVGSSVEIMEIDGATAVVYESEM